MTSTLEAEGRNEGGQFSFGERLSPGQTLVTDGFAVKYQRQSRGAGRSLYNFKLYIIHPTSTDVYFTREGMVFPAFVVEEQDGFVVSKVRTISQVGRVYIGDANLDFEKLFPGEEGQNLDFILTSPGFIGHGFDRGDTSPHALRKAYIQRAQSED